MYTLPYQGAPREDINYGSRLDLGLPPTKLLLRLTEQLLQSSCYTYNRWFSSRPRSPVKYSVLCKYKHAVYYVTNCSTEVGKILFFLFFVEDGVTCGKMLLDCIYNTMLD